MKTYITATANVDVEVEIDLDEAIGDLSYAEKLAFLLKLREQLGAPEPLTEEEKIWQDVRLAAHAGDMIRFLALVEAVAWDHHQVFVDTSRVARAAA